MERKEVLRITISTRQDAIRSLTEDTATLDMAREMLERRGCPKSAKNTLEVLSAEWHEQTRRMRDMQRVASAELLELAIPEGEARALDGNR